MDAATATPLPTIGGPVLTPDSLAPLIRHSNVTGPLWVRGVAKDVRRWSKGSARRCYGKLQHGDVSLPFCLTSGVFPAEGKEIILGGVLTVNRNLAVELQGEVAGSWQSQEIKEDVELPSRTQPVLLLSQFIGENPLEALGFLTTKTGWDDICGAAQLPEVRRCPQQQASFVDETDFLNGLNALVEQGVAGVVIARGGGEKLSAIGDSSMVTARLIEMGLPFYTALGHATDHGLLDKHADQSFLTPTDLAHRLCAYVEAERTAGEDREATEEAERARDAAFAAVGTRDITIQGLKHTQTELDATIAQLRTEVSKQAGARKRLAIAFGIVVAVAMVAALVALLH